MSTHDDLTITERLVAGSDKYLALAELFLVLILTIAIAILAILSLIWIIWTGSLQVQQQRLSYLLKSLSDNWKAALVLLVPLFFRAIRKFIARVTKLPGGVEVATEDERAKPEVAPMKPNPPAETNT
jgi:signal transduction histidine kinase